MALEILQGPLCGRHFTFDGPDTFIFGRSEKAHCRAADDPAVSRFHFMIEIAPPDAHLQDLGSTNGVYVNDVKIGGREPGAVMDVPLAHGDRIRVGQTVFRFQGADGEPAARSPVPATPPRAPRGLVALVGAAVAAENSAAPPEIPGYDGLERVGAGASSVVYRAREAESGRIVAIKRLRGAARQGGGDGARFFREIEITRKVRHPNVVEFIGEGEADGHRFLVLEYMAGGDLARRMAADATPMPLPEAVHVMRQAIAGMAAAHACGVVHRDIKPGNILFADASGRVVKISDLGLAKSLHDQPNLTVTGTGGGTPAYMAPEQITRFRHAQPNADVFSLAATLYELATGQTAYNFMKGRNAVSIILAGDIVPITERRADLPPPLAAFIMRGLAVDAAERFADAGEMLRALGDAWSGE